MDEHYSSEGYNRTLNHLKPLDFTVRFNFPITHTHHNINAERGSWKNPATFPNRKQKIYF